MKYAIYKWYTVHQNTAYMHHIQETQELHPLHAVASPIHPVTFGNISLPLYLGVAGKGQLLAKPSNETMMKFDFSR